MTLRLVALMSVVLLLSLAAVGLLVNHYQERFMAEVQTTAADVGQAALRTLEWRSEEVTRGRARTRAGTQRDEAPALPRTHTEHAPMGSTGALIVAEVDASAIRDRLRSIEHVITTSTDDDQFTVREHFTYPAANFPEVLPGEAFEQRFRECLGERPQLAPGEDHRVFIDVADFHVRTDPAHGLVLNMAMLTPTDGAVAVENEDGVHYELRPATEGGQDFFFARRDEIAFPIRGDYEQLFGKLRNRSLLLFMGVFLVGMALSTGLASRFTRPVRKLDSGIRRLSEGDLDVQVDVKGKGEIGRLSRAFNEMAGKLRANRDREREMVRREKLSSLGRLAAGVAHDVRNPLHSIGLTLQHLSEASRPESEESATEFDRSIGIIRGEIRRLDQLVGNFLRFAKSERHARHPVDLTELVRDTVSLVEKESERRGIRIQLDAAGSLPPVRADGEALRSAILNLILNSFEAMPDGGVLSLDVASGDGEVVVEVSDTGEGIPEDEQQHVFDFAYTTRESGNGLGLAMVHHCVVEEHGGRISLDSRAGEGTRVRVTLPTRPAEAS